MAPVRASAHPACRLLGASMAAAAHPIAATAATTPGQMVPPRVRQCSCLGSLCSAAPAVRHRWAVTLARGRLRVMGCLVLLAASTAQVYIAATSQGFVAPGLRDLSGARGRQAGRSGAVRRRTSLSSSRYGKVGPPEYDGRRQDLWWLWRGHEVRYHFEQPPDADPDEPRDAVVLVHGFGGNVEHWRKNIGYLASQGFDVFAIDLLGYGYSAKPDPRIATPIVVDPTMPERFYNIPLWGEQLADFLVEVVGAGRRKSRARLICNSVGSSVGLQVAVTRPELVEAVKLLNPSLRKLHQKKQGIVEKPFVPLVQWTLRETPVGEVFFENLATAEAVQTVLRQIYPLRPEAVNDEFVQCILRPGLTPGAAKVFMDFISYSAGPLPEEQLAELDKRFRSQDEGVPRVWLGWGTDDPWEPVDEGYELYGPHRFSVVERFERLPGLGHCPMDEAPDLVHPFFLDFLRSPTRR